MTLSVYQGQQLSFTTAETSCSAKWQCVTSQRAPIFFTVRPIQFSLNTLFVIFQCLNRSVPTSSFSNRDCKHNHKTRFKNSLSIPVNGFEFLGIPVIRLNSTQHCIRFELVSKICNALSDRVKNAIANFRTCNKAVCCPSVF